jgi:hypothetical protein
MRRVLISLLGLGALIAAPAGGQAPPPPCPAGVADQPTLEASDLDELQSSTLVATHTLEVQAPDEDGVSVSAPGATLEPKRGFFSDTPGPLPVTVTWTQDDGTGTGRCRAGASTTLQLVAPTPLPRLKNALTHEKVDLKYALGWSYAATLRPLSDHRPVQVSFRGLRRARLPGSRVRFKTVTIPLRIGEPGYQRVRHISLSRLSVQASGDYSALYVKADSTVSTHHSKPLGYDIKLTQAGRLLARWRLAGRCSAFNCEMRKVKVQR